MNAGEPTRAKFITFYSYKGGTGRSMALANVAWILATSGSKVLVIDWDLEAPGLHRYFEPFIEDKTLQYSTGLMDFVLEFATAAVSGAVGDRDPKWYEPYANILAHATSLNWSFPEGGSIDFVPAGRQDASYSEKVNSFNWQQFYVRLGGGVFLELVKQRLRSLYDYVLIDSRTGVSDTSGICTVQMPDELVVCFTLNRQSIVGAASAARSATTQRRLPSGETTLKVWPVPMRIESSEKDRLEYASLLANTRFAELIHHLGPEGQEQYWGEIGVPYEPYYAYEEILAIFRDRPLQTGSLLSRMERLAGYLSHGPLSPVVIDEEARSKGLAAFLTRSASNYREELRLLGEEYEWIRDTMAPGNPRTNAMTRLVTRAQKLAGDSDIGLTAEQIFNAGSVGSRLIGLALARKEPQKRHLEMALDGIVRSRSQFEQFQALNLMRSLCPIIDGLDAGPIASAIQDQMGRTITNSDRSRWEPATDMIEILSKMGESASWYGDPNGVTLQIGRESADLIECRPRRSTVQYNDVEEDHGPFIVSGGSHALRLPRSFFLGKYLVTNRLYESFVSDGGYSDDSLWSIDLKTRQRFTIADGSSLGPAGWYTNPYFPNGRADHPVSGICFYEAEAFLRWLQHNSAGADWPLSLPREDLWEYAARGASGLTYPWGDLFDAKRCNSAETGIGETSEVGYFESGQSQDGYRDLTGNLWEYVSADDMPSNSCVLRGGSYRNNHLELRAYLRLVRVPKSHRAPDFGFRICGVSEESPSENMKATKRL